MSYADQSEDSSKRLLLMKTLEMKLKIARHALECAKRGIEQHAEDTIWCTDADAPNMTVVECIEHALDAL